MRYLEIEDLNSVNNLFDQFEPDDGTRFVARLEAYSCKASSSDKKIWKNLQVKYEGKLNEVSFSKCNDDIVTIPSSPNNSSSSSSFLGLDSRLALITIDGINLRALSYLVSTMNLIFPDYDFCDVEPRNFKRQDNLETVIRDVNNILLSIGITKNPLYSSEISHSIWYNVDAAISTNDCEIYSFSPDDPDKIEDPFTNNSM